jgi:Rrf2 family transcriptional regulator, iron-sulfur cluster assembly transcription factor
MFHLATELGIRGLAVLLTLRGDQLVQSREIAARLGVSATYITKALQPLARRGWLRSTRGRAGGWDLVVDPDTITLADVVRALEPDEQWRKCVVGHAVCSDETACPFHEVWGETRQRFAGVMEETPISELARFAVPAALPPSPGSGPTGLGSTPPAS